MFDVNSMSDTERELLIEIAKAKGQTLDEVLAELGHAVTPVIDKVVSFEGSAEVKAAPIVEPPVVVEKEEHEPVLVEPAVEFKPSLEDPPTPPDAEEELDVAEEAADNEQLSTAKQICIQCGWDQDVPAIEEPEHHDKIAFLQAILGHKVFTKRYTMFGGNLEVTFRTLTIREIDAMYEQSYKSQLSGMIKTSADYYENLNRLRLYLQLTGISAKVTALHVRLPEGLNKAAHIGATSYWDEFLKEKSLFKEDESLLLQVQNYVISHVMRTEHLQRTITHECNKFNRLVAKMEVSVDNVNFWNGTGPQF